MMLAKDGCRLGPEAARASSPLVFGSMRVAHGLAGRASLRDDPMTQQGVKMSAYRQQKQMGTDMCQMVAQPA